MSIKRNAVQCRHCGDVIESRNVHDYVTCSCGTCSVDGGLEYLRRCSKHSREDYIELVITNPTEANGGGQHK